MAEAPTNQASTLDRSEPGSDHESSHYWCYSCDKRVEIETLADLTGVVCFECKNGFVESVPVFAPPSIPEEFHDSNINQFYRLVRRIITLAAAREGDSSPELPSYPADEDYLRIELEGWDNENDEDYDDVGDEEDEDEHSIEIVHEGEADNHEEDTENVRSEGRDEEETDVTDSRLDDDPDEIRRRRRAVQRLRLSDFDVRPSSRRNRILDWAEILMGLEDQSVELRLQVPDSDAYIGNPGDYVDAAGYEALLQNFAESDNGARRGAPPAAKSAVETLEDVTTTQQDDTILCSICKDSVNVGEAAKKLPCGHGYHGECITLWLGSRNSCPVCRYELPTDDLEYEEEKKKRAAAKETGCSSLGNVTEDDFPHGSGNL